MNDNAKKGVLIGVIVLALAVAGYSVFNYSTQDKMVIQNRISMPPGFKNEKERALESQGKQAPDEGNADREKALAGG